MRIVFITVILVSFLNSVAAWDNEELEIFDLVEEINQNFYELIGVNQDATLNDLKRAFRNLSIILHPDKNDAEDANVRFRNLVSVYEVLKDKSKREKYDKVLRDGLPNWKSALYYYRRVRKLGMGEIIAILFSIITIGQYLVAWGVYFEKKYTAEQLFGSKIKKMQKKSKVSVGLDNILSEIPAPSIKNTLPFQIPWLVWNTPRLLKSAFVTINEITQEELENRRRKAEEEKRQREIEEEIIKQKEAKKELKEVLRRRKLEKRAPEKTEEELAGYSRLKVRGAGDGEAIRAVKSTKVTLSGGFWSDEDLLDLVRLVKKYPAGTADRWEVISEQMNRNVSEVTFMAAKLKENGYRVPGHTDSVAENIIQEAEIVKKEKVKTKKGATATPNAPPEAHWSQEQQQALETAITKYPKASSGDRWSKIANNVPGKTREECLLRYKYLVELVKAQREAKKSESETNQQPSADNCMDNGDQEEDVKAEKSITTAKSEDVSQVEVLDEEIDENLQEDIPEPIQNKGKRRNKRKERKKRMEFSSDEDDYSD